MYGINDYRFCGKKVQTGWPGERLLPLLGSRGWSDHQLDSIEIKM